MLSTIMQLVGLTAVVVACLVATGTVPLEELKSAFHLRGELVGDVRGLQTGEVASGGAGAGEGPTAGSAGSKAGASGASSRSLTRRERREREGAARDERRRESRSATAAPAESGCAGSREQTLRRRHPGWPDWVLRAAGCGEVAAGFDAEQVRAVLGKPDTVVTNAAGQEEWVYGNRTIVLRAGQVVAITR